MKNYFNETFYKITLLLIGISMASTIFVSCDIYPYDDKEPDWLGASIYDYMKSEGNFTNYVKLIEDLDYIEVLSKTGSKTLFVANDLAFNEFYENNAWGVKSYSEFTLAQKRLILNFGMINHAYLVEMLANYNNNGLREGAAFRRLTAVSVLDSVTFEKEQNIPENRYWAYYKTKGMYLLKDNTPSTMIFFTQKHLENALITNDDFKIITGIDRIRNDAHVFGIKIINRDITCKNGYLNVLESVLIPPLNMAEYINTSPTTSMFSSVLERFSCPLYDEANTVNYRQLNPGFVDSIFVKKYFAKVGGLTRYPSGLGINSDLLLPYDPGWNSYERTASGNALQSDMATMFVPNNTAMIKYFNSPEGTVLKDRFKSWDSIPIDILPLFIKRHMRSSLIESIPSRFPDMVDEDNSILPVSSGDIEKVYVGTNGLIYETNKVYPPDDYISVYGPVLLSANDASQTNKTKIWNWAIVQNDFRLYLNSLVSKYSFFVPTDEYFKNYIDPVAIAKDVPGALKFWYNTKSLSVNATLYTFDKTTGLVGDSVAVVTNTAFLVNRLLDLLNSHIVVGGVETGNSFYLTKGNVAVKVTGSGDNMTIEGGENIALNEKVKVNKTYEQSNGVTYFIDRPIQSPLQSVYKVLSSTPEFSTFFSLLSGFPATGSSVIFVNKVNYFGVDFNVKFFNTFNYTVYVPTNDALDKAFIDGVLKPWETIGAIEGINSMTNATEKAAEILKLERFLRYHFQDNSVFVDKITANETFQSATIKKDEISTHFGTFKNKYYKIGVERTVGELTLVTETNSTAKVDKTNGLYNIMTRDFIFNAKISTIKEVDGSGSGTDFASSRIFTSSTAVIHQIDKVLSFQ